MYSPCPETATTHPYLTYDETQASEAAFAGRPLNPKWTERAQHIYVELRLVIEGRK